MLLLCFLLHSSHSWVHLLLCVCSMVINVHRKYSIILFFLYHSDCKRDFLFNFSVARVTWLCLFYFYDSKKWFRRIFFSFFLPRLRFFSVSLALMLRMNDTTYSFNCGHTCFFQIQQQQQKNVNENRFLFYLSNFQCFSLPSEK